MVSTKLPQSMVQSENKSDYFATLQKVQESQGQNNRSCTQNATSS